MSCRYEEDLTAYLDGELPAQSRNALEAHLGSCASCPRALNLLRRTMEVVASIRVPEVQISPALRRAVLQRVAEQTLAEKLRAWLSPRVWIPSAGLAAVALLAVVAANRGFTAADPDDEELAQYELAANLEVVEDLDVLGLETEEDLEVLEHLHELEVTP
jgi:anti-sigma factor RsiW